MAEMICPTGGRAMEYTTLEELPYRPFCSARCKLVDLGKWLNEEYRVIEELPEGDMDEEGPPPRGRRDE